MVVPVLLLVAAAASYGYAVLELSRANPGSRLPLFGRPPHVPARHYVFVFGGIFCGVIGTTALGDHVGDSAWLYLLAALLLPTVAVTLWHNRTRARSS